MKPVHITPDHPWYAEVQRVIKEAREIRKRMDEIAKKQQPTEDFNKKSLKLRINNRKGE